MLEDAKGINCQASNFCKTVGVLAAGTVFSTCMVSRNDSCSTATNATELIDYGIKKTDVDYGHIIQTFHRFLIDHLSSEGNAFPHNPLLLTNQSNSRPHLPAAAPISQMLGIDAKSIIICMNCKAVREKENMSHVVDMIYPRKVK